MEDLTNVAPSVSTLTKEAKGTLGHILFCSGSFRTPKTAPAPGAGMSFETHVHIHISHITNTTAWKTSGGHAQ